MPAPSAARRKAAPPPPETEYFVPWSRDALLDRDTTPTSITARLPASAPARHIRGEAVDPQPPVVPPRPAPTALAARLPPLAVLVVLGGLALLLIGGGLALAGRGSSGKTTLRAAVPPGRAPAGTAVAAPADLSGLSEADLLPTGLPITRQDWVITKDYAAHGGDDPIKREKWGAVDFAFWHNKDAFGAPVVATHAGKVKLLKDDPTYGNLVYVQGPQYTTTYGHLQSFNVQEGQVVRRGDVIGGMGSTGQSTGPHVDYQVWKDGKDQNPMDYCQCGMQGSPEPP
jgi:hypothetical protein